jgi:hypothetical protein
MYVMFVCVCGTSDISGKFDEPIYYNFKILTVQLLTSSKEASFDSDSAGTLAYSVQYSPVPTAVHTC